jgi:hypothetical protein
VLKNPGLRRRACRGVRNIANRQTSTTYRVVTEAAGPGPRRDLNIANEAVASLATMVDR